MDRDTLHIRSEANLVADYCVAEVDRDWFRAVLAEANGGPVKLVFGPREYEQWFHGGIALPKVGWDDGSFLRALMAVRVASTVSDPENHQFSVNVIAEVEHDTDHHRFLCDIRSGSVRVASRHGLSRPFLQVAGNVNLNQWLRRMWNEPGVVVTSVAFGASNCELGLLRESDGQRRQVRLQQMQDEAQLWQLTECNAGEASLSPEELLSEFREQTSMRLAGSQSLSVSDATRSQDKSPGVFYWRPDTSSEPSTYVRPNFGIEFRDREKRRIWSPKTLAANNEKLTFVDSDDVANLFSEEDAERVEDQVHVQWKIVNSSWTYESMEHPEMVCVGLESGRLPQDRAWLLAETNPRPESLTAAMPTWVELQLPDHDLAELPDVDFSLPLPLDVNGADWILHLEDTGSLRLEVSDASVELRSQGGLGLSSPTLLQYARRLADPSSVPNAKVLREAGAAANAAETTLRSTRLVFATRTKSGEDTRIPLIRLASPDTLEVTATNDAAIMWPPFALDACVNFLSGGAKNLTQSVDPQTLRAIVERDFTHGLCRFRLTAFELGANGTIQSAESTAVEEQIRGSMTLAPWVEMLDVVNANDRSPDHRRLHHRNLALEHGEFAAASEDRSRDGQANALAANVTDFVKAVRDPFTIATLRLPIDHRGPGEADVEPEEVLHWAPGAVVDDAPAVWMQVPEPAVEFQDRIPTIHLPAFEQQLNIADGIETDELLDWLTADVRFDGFHISGETVRPMVDVEPTVSVAGELPEDGAQRARNGSLPLLFDHTEFTVVSADSRRPHASTTPLSWFVAGRDDTIRIYERTDPGVSSSLPGASGEWRGVGNGMENDQPWVIGFNAAGAARLWRRSEEKWAEPQEWLDLDTEVQWGTVAAIDSRVAMLLMTTDGPALSVLELDQPVSEENPKRVVGFPDVASGRWDLMWHAESLLAAGVHEGACQVWTVVRDGDDWTASLLDWDTPPSATSVSLAMIEDEVYLGVVDAVGRRCELGVVSSDEWAPVDGFPVTGAGMHPVGIHLVNRVFAADGLARGALPLWLCIQHSGGLLDVWQVTPGREKFPSAEPNAVDLFGPMKRPPYRRWRNVFGGLTAQQAAWLTRTVEAPAGVTERSDAAMISIGSDGVLRWLDLEAGGFVSEQREYEWLLDNLSKLNRRRQTFESNADILISEVSRPVNVAAGREDPLTAHPELGTMIAVTRATDPAQPGGALTRHEHEGALNTDIHWSCDKFWLTRTEDGWAPLKVGDKAGEFAASRGSFGSSGFHATGRPSKEHWLAGLPLVCGAPVHIDEILLIQLAPHELGHAASGQIQKMILRGVLVNPLLLDGFEPSLDDIRRGVLPMPIAQARDEQSFIEIVLERVDDVLRVTSVESPQPIAWNTMATARLGMSASRFAADLTEATFSVRLDEVSQKIALEVAPKQGRVQSLGGTQPTRSGFQLHAFLSDRGEASQATYGFTTPWHRQLDPIATQAPLTNLVSESYDATLSADPSVPCFVALLDNRIDVWHTETGRLLRQLAPPEGARTIAMGRAAVPTIVSSISANGFLLGGYDCQHPGPPKPYEHIRPRAGVTTIGFTSGTDSRVMVGDEGGEISIWSSASGSARRVPLSGGAITSLRSCESVDGPLVAAVSGRQLAVFTLGEAMRPVVKVSNAAIRSVECANHESGTWGASRFDNQIEVWEFRDDALHVATTFALAATSIAIGSHADARAVFANVSGELKVLSPDDTFPSLAVDVGNAVLSYLAVSESERWLVAATTDAPLRTWRQFKTDGTWGDWEAASLATKAGDVPLALALTVTPDIADGQTEGRPYALLAPQRFGAPQERIQVVDLVEDRTVSTPTIMGTPGDAVPFTAGSFWQPHCAVGTNELLQVVDLESGDLRAVFEGLAGLGEIRFPASDSNGWLAAVDDGNVRIWNAATWSQTTPTLPDSVIDLASVGEHLLAATAAGAFAWHAGSSTAPNLLSDNSCDQVSALVDLNANQLVHVVTRLSQGEETQLEWLRFVKTQLGDVTAQAVVLPGSIDTLGLVWVDEGLHCLAIDEAVASGIGVVSLEHESTRWILGDSKILDGIVVDDHVQFYLAGDGGLNGWRLHSHLRLDSRGRVEAEAPFALEWEQGELPLSAHIQADHTVTLTRGEDERSQVLAATQSRGLYMLLDDLVDPLQRRASNAIGLWRTTDGTLSGAELSFGQEAAETTVLIHNGESLDCQIAFNWQWLNALAAAGSDTSQVQVTGSISIPSEEGANLVIFVVDQVLEVGKETSITGYLDYRLGSQVIQGPMQLSIPLSTDFGVTQIKLAPTIFRGVPVEEPTRDDSIQVEAVVPRPHQPNKNEDVQVGWQGLDMRVPTRADVAGVFLTLIHDGKQAAFHQVEDRRVPVDLCLDDRVRFPYALAPADRSQLGHLRGMGVRLRFPLLSPAGLSATPVGEVLEHQPGVRWMLQPVVLREGRVALLDAGLVAEPVDLAGVTVRTDNLLLMQRPHVTKQDIVVCAGSSTSLSSQTDAALQPPDSAAIALAMELKRFGQVTVAVVDSEVRQEELGVSSAAVELKQLGESLTSTTSWEAMDWMLDERPFAALPSNPDDERDNDRTAWREFLLGREDVLALDRDWKPVEASVSVAESTANIEPSRSRLPSVDSLVSLVDMPDEEPNNATDAVSFQPAKFRIRLAPDKPGAMSHHRFVAAERDLAPLHTDSDTDSPEDESQPRRELLARRRESVHFSVREPMQLNPPAGASLQLLAEQCSLRPVTSNLANVSFAWKEVLGRLPITARGECIIAQTPSQTSEGVRPEDVKLELSPDSQHCMQLMVQINDQLVDINQRQPNFPIYDARKTAKTLRPVEASSRTQQLRSAGLSPNVEGTALISSRNETYAMHLAREEVVAWRLSRQPVRMACDNLSAALASRDRLEFEQDGETVATAVVVEFRPDSDSDQRGVAILDEIRGQILDGMSFEAGGGATGNVSGPVAFPQQWTPDSAFSALPIAFRWNGNAAVAAAAGDSVEIRRPGSLDVELEKFSALPAAIGQLASTTVAHQASVSDCLAGLASDGSQVRLWIRQGANLSTEVLDTGATFTQLRVIGSGTNQLSLVLWSDDANSVALRHIELEENGAVANVGAPQTLDLPAVMTAVLEVAQLEEQAISILGVLEGGNVGAVENGAVTREYILGRGSGEVEAVHVLRAGGRQFMAAVASNRMHLWEAATGQELRNMERGEAETRRTALGLGTIAGKAMLTASTADQTVEIYDLFLSQQVPPNVFLATSLENLGPLPRIPVKVKLGDDSITLFVQLAPMLILGTRGGSGEVAEHLGGVFVESTSPPQDGRRLYQLNTNNFGEPGEGQAHLSWSTARNARLAWRGVLEREIRPPSDEDDPGEYEEFSPRTELEVVFGEPNGVKQIQLIPYDVIAPKCAAVMMVDEMASEDEVEREVLQRTLMFGESANASRGEGVLAEDTGKLWFAFEVTDSEQVDTALPVVANRRVGLTLVKHFVSGQTQCDTVALPEPEPPS